MLRRLTFALLLALVPAAAARAHFVFVVPEKDGTVRVVFSDSLAPDERVDIAKIGSTRLFTRDSKGVDAPLSLEKGKHALEAKVSAKDVQVLFGTTAYGVLQRDKSAPYLLKYHSKAILGSTAKVQLLGKTVPVELVPMVDNGKVRFQLLVGGKPATKAEVTVLVPGKEKSEKVATDAKGETPAFAATGQYGVWARSTEAASGTHDGKKYDEIRHYATLVVQFGGAPTKAETPATRTLPPLPTGASSLGAVVCEGYLYVYGGHAGKTHTYSTKDVLGTFQRLNLTGGGKWESLPGGPILQGMNLATHGGKVYRVGGMQPRNEPGAKADNHSVTDCARFDPKSGKWEAIEPLPVGRSSHDVVVVGDKLVVVGGWQSRGQEKSSVWPDTALILDLSQKDAKWKQVTQPFQRRALTATAVGNKVYVLCGLGSTAAEQRVDILDLGTAKWSTGPDVPGKRVGFSPAANTINGRLVLSTSDGSVYRLSESGTAWEKVGTSSRRMVHRLVPYGNAALLVGGATPGGGGNLTDLEVVPLAEKGEKAAN